jgi:cell division septal protein FtsQ
MSNGSSCVTVSERRAVAWVDAGGGAALVVDPSGRVLSLDPTAPPGLPQLVGVTAPITPGATVAPTAGARVAGVLAGIVRESTRSITTGDDGRVTLGIASGQEIRLGRPVQLADKIRAAVAVLGAPEAQGTAYVDVSAPSNPVAG